MNAIVYFCNLLCLGAMLLMLGGFKPLVYIMGEDYAILLIIILAVLIAVGLVVGLVVDIFSYFIGDTFLMSVVITSAVLVLCLETFCYFVHEKLAISIILHFTVLIVVVFVFGCSIAFGIFLGAIASSLVNFYIL